VALSAIDLANELAEVATYESITPAPPTEQKRTEKKEVPVTKKELATYEECKSVEMIMVDKYNCKISKVGRSAIVELSDDLREIMSEEMWTASTYCMCKIYDTEIVYYIKPTSEIIDIRTFNSLDK